MKFYFTIYLLAKVFNFQINDTGGSEEKKIFQFFDILKQDRQTLTTTIKGKNQEKYALTREDFSSRIITDASIPGLSRIDRSLLEYAYERFVGARTADQDIASLFSDLLKKSLEPTPQQQRQMYESYNDHSIAYIAVQQIKQRSFDESTLTYNHQFIQNESYEQQNAEFIKSIEAIASQITSVQLAFHGGHEWLRMADPKNALLRTIVSNNVPVQVLINEIDAIQPICIHMRDPIAYKTGGYSDFSVNRENWMNFASLFPSVQLRECPIPLMRRYACFTTAQKQFSKMRVAFYTYGETNYKLNYQIFLSPESTHFAIYEKEFEYLWQLSRDIHTG